MMMLASVLACALALALAACLYCAARLAAERRAGEEKERTLAARLDAIVAKVSDVTARSLAARERELAMRNVEQVGPLFAGLRDDLRSFREAAAGAQKENHELGAALKTQLDEVGRKAEGLGRQADEFVAALKGGNKVQGNWGEGILSKTLLDAGLVKGVNFVEQSGTSEDRPDVTVMDGEGHKVFIDAKVNITDFIEAVNAANEGRSDDAAELMKRHAASVRAQVKRLAAKDYPKKLGGAEVVVMFLPSEATYAAAVSADPALIAFANACRIVLATPQMLLSFLMLFRLGIVRQQLEKNNKEIRDSAEMVIQRVDAAFAELEGVGKALESATARYHETMKKLGLESGGRNVLTPARRLIELTNSTSRRASKMLDPGGAESR